MNPTLTPLLSIVIPCYNEATGLAELLESYHRIITRDDIEVILVDNGSTDNTADLLKTLAPQYQRFLQVLTITTNHGYGFGILSGLRVARGEFIGWTHGDLQTSPTDILKVLSMIQKADCDKNLYLKGLRKKRPLCDNLFTFGMSLFETIYLKRRLHDINAQPNIFHRNFYTTWENPPHDFSLDLFALYQAKKTGLNVVRFPVLLLPRTHGHSSWNTGLLSRWRLIKRTIVFSASLKKRKS